MIEHIRQSLQFFVIHNVLNNHIFDFQDSNIIVFIHDKNKLRMIESSTISYYKTIQRSPGIYKISLYQTKMMLKDFNLHKQ